MRKTILMLAAALIATAPIAATVTATPIEAAQPEIKKQGGNRGGGQKAQSNRKYAPKGNVNRSKNVQRSKTVRSNARKVPQTAVRGGNARNNNRYARNHNRNRSYNNNHYYNNRRYYYRGGYGWGWWAPSAVAAGVVAGAVLAAPVYAAPVYAAPSVTYYEGAAGRIETRVGSSADGGVPPAGGYAAFSPGWYDYCSSKYRSFDPDTGTYLGYDGLRHYCQ